MIPCRVQLSREGARALRRALLGCGFGCARKTWQARCRCAEQQDGGQNSTGGDAAHDHPSPPFKASLRTVRLDEIVACFLEVLADQGMRLLRIALVERVEDAAMLSIVVVYHIGREDLLLHRVPLRM
jgi:hypothetical protein